MTEPQRGLRAPTGDHAGAERAPAVRSETLRLLLQRHEAADALGMSLDHFERHVQPHIALVRSGRLRLVPARELERWVTETMERVGY